MDDMSFAFKILTAWAVSSREHDKAKVRDALESLNLRQATGLETLWCDICKARLYKKEGALEEELHHLALATESADAPTGLALILAQEMMGLGRFGAAVPILERVLRSKVVDDGLQACLDFMSPFKVLDPRKDAAMMEAFVELSQFARNVCHVEVVLQRTYEHLGICFEHMRDTEPAVQAYLSAIALKKSATKSRYNSSAMVGLARSLFAAGQYDTLLHHLEDVGPDETTDASLAGMKAVSLIQIGDACAAVPFFERAIALDPSDIASRINYARFLDSQGLHESAREHYRVMLQNPAVDGQVLQECRNALVGFASG